MNYSCIVGIRGVVVKHFEVEGKGATGVVMLMGKKNVAVKVQLSYDGASLVVDNVLRRAKLELEGTMLRDGTNLLNRLIYRKGLYFV